MKRKKYISKQEALQKLQRYCAYQDRCHQEVRTKLLEIGSYGDDLEEVIVELIQENFLNEERFARSYARGKFRIRRWGRNKIKQELKQRRISAYCIKKAMEELEEFDYNGTLQKVLDKKWKESKETNVFKKRSKIGTYLISRGFESHLVWSFVKAKS